MTVPVSEQLVSMLVVFMVVSLAAERVVQVLKNGLRTLGQKKTGGNQDSSERQTQAAANSVEAEGDWAKFWPRAMAVLAGIGIAYFGRAEIGTVLQGTFPTWAEGYGWREAIVIGLFSAAGSDLWSQLLGIVKDIKEAKKLNLQETLRKLTPS